MKNTIIKYLILWFCKKSINSSCCYNIFLKHIYVLDSLYIIETYDPEFKCVKERQNYYVNVKNSLNTLEFMLSLFFKNIVLEHYTNKMYTEVGKEVYIYNCKLIDVNLDIEENWINDVNRINKILEKSKQIY